MFGCSVISHVSIMFSRSLFLSFPKLKVTQLISIIVLGADTRYIPNQFTTVLFAFNYDVLWYFHVILISMLYCLCMLLYITEMNRKDLVEQLLRT